MKNCLFILLLLWLFSSCNDFLEDPDTVRTGIAIEEELITSQIWKVEYFDNKPERGAAGFQGAFLEFNMDNTFDLINSNRQIYTGEWALSATKDLLVVRSDGKIPAPYNELENEWVILNSDHDNIRIQERDPNGTEEIEFSAAPDREIPNVCEGITKLIKDKSWHIQHLVIANSVRTSDYERFEFTFDSEATAIATAGTNQLEGSWNAGIRCNKFHFGFYQYADLNEISGLWRLSYFTESTFKLLMNREGLSWELTLISGQNVVDNLCEEAKSTIRGGSWTVSKFVTGNDSYGTDFSDYLFQFKEEGKLSAFYNDTEYTGNWSLVDGCEKMPITIEGNEVLDKINGDWQLVLVSKELLKLIAETENNKKEIQFVRDLGSISLCDSLDRLYEDDMTWHVTSYQVNNENRTEWMEGVNITFSKDNTLVIATGNVKTNGTWKLEEDCKKVSIKAESSNVDNNDVINSIALEWNITKATEEKIILVHENETDSIELQLTL